MHTLIFGRTPVAFMLRHYYFFIEVRKLTCILHSYFIQFNQREFS